MADLFPRDSVVRRVNAEPALFLAAGRALLLQLAHPAVAQGVADIIREIVRRFVAGHNEHAVRAAKQVGVLANCKAKGQLPHSSELNTIKMAQHQHINIHEFLHLLPA